MRYFVVVAVLLAGCAADLPDVSNKEPACARSCTSSYSTCLGHDSRFPIAQQHQCADAMQACASTCPAK